MKKIILGITLMTLIFMYSFTQENMKISDKSEKGDIVLILDKIPNNSKYFCKDGSYFQNGGNFEITYNVKDIVSIYFSPNYLKEKDTIIIKSVSGLLEIQHKYNGIDMFSFIAKANDTLFISY